MTRTVARTTMETAMRTDARPPATPPWLFAFCYALMGPAVGINAVFVALAIPATAPYGVAGMAIAFGLGAALGSLPAIWLARRIHAGIREEE